MSNEHDQSDKQFVYIYGLGGTFEEQTIEWKDTEGDVEDDLKFNGFLPSSWVNSPDLWNDETMSGIVFYERNQVNYVNTLVPYRYLANLIFDGVGSYVLLKDMTHVMNFLNFISPVFQMMNANFRTNNHWVEKNKAD